MTEILQKTENVANNVANKNSQDLTSQWKKGELQDGWYWVKKKTCEEYIDKVYFWYDTFIDGDVPLDNDKVIEVLAKVPDYNEWKAAYEYEKYADNEIKNLKAQNAELKDTIEALKSELKEVCDVLIRKCPEMKEWVMLNWKNLYEVQDE